MFNEYQKGLIVIFRMSNKTKKITAIIIIVFFLFAFVMPFIFTLFVEAAPLSNYQQKKQDTKNQINDIKNENKDILAEKEKADHIIKGIQDNMDGLQEEINAHEARLSELETELSEASAAASNQYEALKKRIRVMYEQGSDSYLEVLLSSGNIYDFLNRFEIIKQITEYDNNMLEKLRDTMKKIETATAQVQQEKSAKAGKLSSYQNEKAKLDDEQKKRDSIVDENKQEIAQLEKTLKEVEAAEARERAAAAVKVSTGVKYTGGAMEWPAPGNYSITSQFGWRIHPLFKTEKYHSGIDIGVPSGSSVIAANDGTVIVSKYSSSYGNYIMIDHGGGIVTLYAHGSKLLASVGTQVKRGQQIMKSGSTGYSTGPHLHFEVIVGGKNVDPQSYVK